MEESYTEGLASHGDPESCADVREGAGEALTGVHTGGVLSRETNQTRVPPMSYWSSGNIRVRAKASARVTWRGRRPLARVETPCARTGRSRVRPEEMASQGLGRNRITVVSSTACGKCGEGVPRNQLNQDQGQWTKANHEG